MPEKEALEQLFDHLVDDIHAAEVSIDLGTGVLTVEDMPHGLVWTLKLLTMERCTLDHAE